MIRRDDQNQRKRCDHIQRDEALACVIAEIGNDRGRNRHLSRGTNENGVAIGRLMRCKVRRDAATSPYPVFDDCGRARIFLELLHDKPCEQIVTAAGGKPDNEMNWTARIVGLCACNTGRKCDKQRRKRADDSLFCLDHCIPRLRSVPPVAHLKSVHRGRPLENAFVGYATVCPSRTRSASI